MFRCDVSWCVFPFLSQISHCFPAILLYASCPGSVMILARLPNGNINLHTGDFRAHANMLEAPCVLADLVQNDLSNQRIDTIFLDTT